MPNDTSMGRRWLLPALAPLFLLSGASALVYQLLWLRRLGLVFGVTVYAASTVWASFMAGLALGSFGAGRLADRVRRPLVWFGAAELGIAVTAATTPFVLDALGGLYPNWSGALRGDPVAASLLPFGLSLVVLLVPTVLMGATLPPVVKSSLFRVERLGASAGVLYAANTAGAIVGVLISGLYLIPNLGMTATFRTAGLLNLTVATGAIILAALTRRAPSDAGTARAIVEPPTAAEALSPDARRLVLLVFAVSGAAALALEVIWLRVIALYVGPTVYAVAILLASVLVGNAAGSAVMAPFVSRGGRWLVRLAWAEAAIAFVGLLSAAVLPMIPAAVQSVPPALAGLMPSYLVPVLTGSALVALPTTLLMGMAFPIGLQLWAVRPDDRRASSAASRVGVFRALNLCGGIAGSLLAGFLLLPWLGSRASLITVCAVVLGSALALIAACPFRTQTRAGAASALLIAFITIATVLPDPVDALLAARHPHEPILWKEEGVQSTVSVHDLMRGRRTMYSEGIHQADDTGGMAFTHRTIGTLALALHPNPRTALVVGLGGGATAGAASQYPGLGVDVVELSAAVVRASDFFRHINFDLLRRPNVHVRIGDGRNYLALTRQRYDVITADAIQPVRTGSASLYSVEYFRLQRDALNDSGMTLQWFGGSDAEYKLVARTFLSVFPNATAWGDGTLLLGTKGPLRLRAADFDWKLQVPECRDAFRSIGVNRFEDLVAMFRAGPEDLRRFVGEGPLLTDDRPILEYFLSLPRTLGLNVSALPRNVRPYLEP